MGTYNEELVKAGVMLAGEGLEPSSHGKLVDFAPEREQDRGLGAALVEAGAADGRGGLADRVGAADRRGDLLARLGRMGQASEEFERAAALTANDSERAHLLRRAAAANAG